MPVQALGGSPRLPYNRNHRADVRVPHAARSAGEPVAGTEAARSGERRPPSPPRSLLGASGEPQNARRSAALATSRLALRRSGTRVAISISTPFRKNLVLVSSTPRQTWRHQGRRSGSSVNRWINKEASDNSSRFIVDGGTGACWRLRACGGVSASRDRAKGRSQAASNADRVVVGARDQCRGDREARDHFRVSRLELIQNFIADGFEWSAPEPPPPRPAPAAGEVLIWRGNAGPSVHHTRPVRKPTARRTF